ncbi:MAG: class I adenylate cyclase [Pseudomonadota bacterium]
MSAPENGQKANLQRLAKALLKGKEAFFRNNVLRVKELQSYGIKGYRHVFLHVPFLLQVNHPEVPGYLEGADVPRGIHGFVRSDFIKVAPKLFPSLGGQLERAVFASRPVVQSLLLMGSSGSVGHTAASDLDYWVCLDESRLSHDELHLLRRKLDLVSAWAWEEQATEVNFYIVNLVDLAQNRLKPQGEETEGEVAPLLLKEELYRTVLQVAGRAPLWWAAPLGLDFERYQRLPGHLDRLSAAGLEPGDFIDLGFPLRPDPQEYMAAALWLSQKSEADPFKAALKMVIILEQVESGLKAPLLCDLVKSAVYANESAETPVDPYAVTIRRVLDYGHKRLDPEPLELLRLSAYYKVRGALDPYKAGQDTPKTRLLQEFLRQWEWDEKKTEKVNTYSSWPEREKLDLGRKMKSMLYDLYRRTAQRLINDYPDQVTAEDRSLATLKGKILARYSDHQAKVEDLPSSLHRKTLPKQFTLIYQGENWELYGGRYESLQTDSEETLGTSIKQFPRAARAAAWLAHNSLFDKEMKLRLLPRPGPVSLEAMMALLEKINQLFPEKPLRAKSEESSQTQGGEGPRLLVVNLEETWYESKISSTDLIYRTGWGEMRHFFKIFSGDEPEAERILAIYQLLKDTGEVRPQDLHFVVTEGATGRKIQNNLRVALSQALTGTMRTKGGFKGPDQATRLDTD